MNKIKTCNIGHRLVPRTNIASTICLKIVGPPTNSTRSVLKPVLPALSRRWWRVEGGGGSGMAGRWEEGDKAIATEELTYHSRLACPSLLTQLACSPNEHYITPVLARVKEACHWKTPVTNIQVCFVSLSKTEIKHSKQHLFSNQFKVTTFRVIFKWQLQ